MGGALLYHWLGSQGYRKLSNNVPYIHRPFFGGLKQQEYSDLFQTAAVNTHVVAALEWPAGTKRRTSPP